MFVRINVLILLLSNQFVKKVTSVVHFFLSNVIENLCLKKVRNKFANF